jgi:hypothetical protein
MCYSVALALAMRGTIGVGWINRPVLIIGSTVVVFREVLMNASVLTLSSPTIPFEVHEFAAEKGVSHCLNAVIDLARRAFPSSALSVSLGQDAEDETHRYVALDVDAGSKATEELLAGQRTWSAGLGSICPSRDAVYFVLGWR